MKDPHDDITADLLGEAAPARGRGRPRKYASAAEKQAAYRQRLAERGLVEQRRVIPRRVGDHEQPVSSILDLSGDVGAALKARHGDKK